MSTPTTPTDPPGDNEDRMMRSLVEAVLDYAIFRISPQGIVESWNSGAERIKGYTSDDIIGESFAVFYTPEDRAAGRPAQALAAAARDGRFEDEAWRVRRDGTRFRAAVVIDAITGRDGGLEGFAKVTRDITARYELERTREHLHQAQRLETIGQLTSGVAHDFNNLLSAIIGSFDLVSRYSSDERVERIVDAGLIAASRGQRLVAQLLAFARQQELRPEASDINALILMLHDLLVSAVGERIEMRCELDPALPLVALDQAQFQSALLNLIVNARDAMPRGGTLTLRTALRAPSGQVEVEVRDNGAGMAGQVRARAIEPFFTTKPAGAGSGLGLSQVFGFVTQSGGQLEIDSAPAQGSTIRMLLPLPEAMENPQQPGRRGRPTVLLVEDDAAVRTVCEQMLRNLGYDVITADDATEALTMLERNLPIDLLFSDIVMPRGITGAELARHAVALRPNLRILLASAHPRDTLQGRSQVSADVVFLQKPFRMTALEQAMQSLLPGEPTTGSGG